MASGQSRKRADDPRVLTEIRSLAQAVLDGDVVAVAALYDAITDIRAILPEIDTYRQWSELVKTLPTRVRSMLQDLDITSLEELVACSPAELLEASYFGRKSLQKLEGWLAQRGLKLDERGHRQRNHFPSTFYGMRRLLKRQMEQLVRYRKRLGITDA